VTGSSHEIAAGKNVYFLRIEFSRSYFDFFFMSTHALNLQLQELLTNGVFSSVFSRMS
jgi:hypothetical protein